VKHHFAHEHLTTCTPETVNRAVLRRWLALGFEAVRQRQPAALPLRWKCLHCGQVHQANMLAGIQRVIESADAKGHFADIALVDEAGVLHGAIIIQEALTPDESRVFTKGERFLVLLPHTATPDHGDLAALLRQGRIVNGPCPTLRKLPTLVRDPAQVRRALIEAVAKFPGYAYAAVEATEGVFNTVRLGDNLLLLDRERWLRDIGGARNRVAPGVEVLIQTEQHGDGGVIHLYFVTVRETHAVGVRRYSPGVTPTLQLEERHYHRPNTALDVARHLVTK
jgi:hypothetical protein